MELADRARKILQIIVEDYVEKAEPVGSRVISRHYYPGISPATVRNEMADLEEEGYIYQPYTSAGRVPSDNGYRYYVDNLMSPHPLTHKEERFIREEYRRISFDLEQIIHQTLKLLSTLVDYAAIIMAPQDYRRTVKIVQLVLLNLEQILVILRTESGVTSQRLLELKNREGLIQEDLNNISRLLTDKLAGVAAEEIQEPLFSEILYEMPAHKDLLEVTLHLIRESMLRHRTERVYSGGFTNILRQPEFHNLDRAQSLLKILEEEKNLAAVLAEAAENPAVSVKIGRENKNRAIQTCSVITGTYRVRGNRVGSLGVIGPTRMNYDRVKAAVETVAGALSEFLTREEI